MKLARFILLSAACISIVHADTVIVRLPSGESMALKVDSDETFATVLSRVDHEIYSRDVEGLDKPREFVLDYGGGSKKMFPIHCRSNVAPRKFYEKVTDKERKDIETIVNSTGSKSVTELFKIRKSLEHTGDRVNHIHPLRFFIVVFSDEKMKVNMHKLKDRTSWIWDDFISGMGESFDQEAKAGNLKDEYIQEVASTLHVDVNVIKPIIRANKWEDLILKLIEIIPRSGNPDRYN